MAVLGFEELGDIGGANFHFQSGSYAVEGFDALAGEPLTVLVQVNEAGGHHEAGDVDRTAPAQRAAEMRAILPSRMPTLRTASREVSGSMTRPPSSTRSYCWA